MLRKISSSSASMRASTPRGLQLEMVVGAGDHDVLVEAGVPAEPVGEADAPGTVDRLVGGGAGEGPPERADPSLVGGNEDEDSR